MALCTSLVLAAVGQFQDSLESRTWLITALVGLGGGITDSYYFVFAIRRIIPGQLAAAQRHDGGSAATARQLGSGDAI